MSTTTEEPNNSCPDCAQGKHDLCTNEAWDWLGDRPAPCDCAVLLHHRQPPKEKS